MGTADNKMFEEALKGLREEADKLEKRVVSFEKLIDAFIKDYNNLKNKNKTK
jgi:hypothetical protein